MGWHLTIALVLSPYEYKLQQYKKFNHALFHNNNCLRRRELNLVAKSEKRVWIFFIAWVYTHKEINDYIVKNLLGAVNWIAHQRKKLQNARGETSRSAHKGKMTDRDNTTND